MKELSGCRLEIEFQCGLKDACGLDVKAAFPQCLNSGLENRRQMIPDYRFRLDCGSGEYELNLESSHFVERP